MSSVSAADRTGTRRWWLLAVVGFAQLLVMIDTTIVNIALPEAQRELGISDAGRQWAITSYTLAFGGLLLVTGRLADRFGRRTTLLVGIAGFAVASAVGGAAVNGEMLIAARTAQGLFAALIAPSTMALIHTTFSEPRDRAQAFAIYGAIMMSGAAVGLVAGGALTQYLDWRWCMYVNLPVAAVAMVAGWFLLPVTPAHETPIDWVSGVLGGGIVLLVYGAGEVGTRGWNSPAVVVTLALAVLMLGGFVMRQTHLPTPLLPLAILRERRRGAAYLAVAAVPFGLFGMLLILTYQFQEVMRYGPLHAGLAFMPMLLGNVVVATQATRRLMPKVGPRPLLSSGLVLCAIGMGMLILLTPDASFWLLIVPAELLLGFGTGLVMPVVGSTATNGVRAEDTGAAAAFVSTAHLVGASIGTSVLNTVATVSAEAGTVEATVRGFTAAAAAAAAVLLAATLVTALLAPSGPNP